MDCPICLRTTAASPCECGYDFATRDVAEAARRATRIAARARAKIIRGLLLFGSLPLTVLLAIAWPTTAVRGVLFFAFPTQLIVGVGWIARGWSWNRSARSRIQRTRMLAQLPAARVIARD